MPNADATANSAASSLVSMKPLNAVACAIELQISVCRPPMRSASQPQNWRDRNAVPSSPESMAAPRSGAKPRSPQNATICDDGIAIGTQQQKIATIRTAMATLGDRPNTGIPDCGSAAGPPGSARGTGGGRRKIATSATIETRTNSPNAVMVRRQPQWLMPAWNSMGHTAPDSDWPEEIKATAAPRLRSNQRLT